MARRERERESDRKRQRKESRDRYGGGLGIYFGGFGSEGVNNEAGKNTYEGQDGCCDWKRWKAGKLCINGNLAAYSQFILVFNK